MARLRAKSPLTLTLTLGAAGVTLVALAVATAASGAGAATTAGTPGPTAKSKPIGRQSTPVVCGTSGVSVSTASQLSAALAGASPGETILLAPGTYSGQFEATVSGTPSAPITLCGPRDAVLDGGAIASGYTFYLDNASWWQIEGFTVTGGQKGVVTDTSSHDVIDGLYVYGIGDEAIHLRDFSTYDTVSDNEIRDTGLYQSFYGEGIYIGSANKNWCRYSGCLPDASDHNVITGNNIDYTTAENVDIKEGTSSGTITGNQFNGTGMNPADATSWVNVKGNAWTVSGNTGTDSVQDGFSVHQVYPGWGIGNTFTGNQATVNGPGYGFYVQSRHLSTVVSCGNTVSGAKRGFSTIACTA